MCLCEPTRKGTLVDMFRVFKVEGHSLYPYLKEGQRVICFKLFRFTQIKIGDFVLFTKKPHGLMIKRVDDVKEGGYFVKGTDPMSIDSHNFGLIERADIQYKLWPFRLGTQIQPNNIDRSLPPRPDEHSPY